MKQTTKNFWKSFISMKVIAFITIIGLVVCCRGKYSKTQDKESSYELEYLKYISEMQDYSNFEIDYEHNASDLMDALAEEYKDAILRRDTAYMFSQFDSTVAYVLLGYYNKLSK